MTRLLMIEDDRALAEMVATYLGRAGMTLEHRESAEAGLAAAVQGGYDAVVLDLMLPDGDGLEICRAIRARSDVPILMLTARGEEADRIVGLEIGADDYLPKPFNPRELLARLRAIMRRRTPGSRAALQERRCASAGSSSTVRHGGCRSTARSERSPATSSTCSARSPRARAACSAASS